MKTNLFIRTNGTCEENTFNELFEKVSERVNDFQIGNRIEPLDKYAELENKLKKKNEILKKSRIKRKNQREELHKLNLKLKDCVTREHFESHISSKNSVIKIIEDDRIFKYNMYQVSLEEKTDKLNEATNKMDELRAMRFERDIEIEKLKTVIEYLESQIIELTEKEKVMECIKALSKIEGYTMFYEGMKRTNILYDNIDLLMKYFEDKNKELNK